MKVVWDFAEGKLSYDEFEAKLYLHPEIWDYLQSLVPDDIENPNSEFRKRYGQYGCVSALVTNGSHVKSTLTAFDFNGRNAHCLISSLMAYYHPEIKVKQPYEESPEELLFRWKLDYLGGKEADDLVREVMATYREDGVKTVKAKLKEAFGITGRKHPHWVQEAEWPFFEGKPMAFISETHKGERFVYVFRDEVSRKEIVIEQLA